jgi:hypothetical protein
VAQHGYISAIARIFPLVHPASGTSPPTCLQPARMFESRWSIIAGSGSWSHGALTFCVRFPAIYNMWQKSPLFKGPRMNNYRILKRNQGLREKKYFLKMTIEFRGLTRVTVATLNSSRIGTRHMT